MGKTIVAIAGGVVLGIAVAFANAGAFPLWSNDTPGAAKPVPTQAETTADHQPAPPNSPEPGEKVTVMLPSWAPLVKRVMPAVVNVAVVQEVKTGASPFGEPDSGDESGGDPGNGG